MDNLSDNNGIAMTANLCALRSFSFSTLFRVGEATRSGPANSFDPRFDTLEDDQGGVLPPLRLTRDMIRFVTLDGEIVSAQVFPPPIKNMANNPFARHMIEIRHQAGSFPETVMDLYRIFLLDPVLPSLWKSTPLFRDPMSNKPIAPRMLIKMDREAIRELSHFDGRDPLRFAGHSYRIGGVEALVAAGCPDLIIQAMGRWSSYCWRVYVRLGSQIIDKWRRKMCEVVASAGVSGPRAEDVIEAFNAVSS